MAESEKDRLAKQVADLRVAFDLALSDKRKYPVTEFNAFVRSARNYIKITAGDVMVHKSVVQAVNGLREFLQVERQRACSAVAAWARTNGFKLNIGEIAIDA